MNCLTWTEPPRTDEDLQIWKVFVATQRDEVWTKVHRWLKRFGNPYTAPFEFEDYDVKARRILYQLALTHVVQN
jgi:hypothetical protein